MSDAISAASLLMAVVAILYGAWYQEIMQAIKITIPKHDRAIPLSTVNQVLISRCLPLASMATVIFFVFLPDAFQIIKHSLSVGMKLGTKSYTQYDSVRTAFCLVSLVSFAIAMHLCKLTATLFGVRKKLMPP